MATKLLAEDREKLGGYWLAARLGSGGQGVVYEAYGPRGDRVALKTLHRDAQEVARSRFVKEAEAARRVAPFCTAKVLEAGLDGDTPYIVTEYVEGRTLDDSIRQGGPLPEDSLIRLAIGVATALAAIHHSGVLHRDLKPGNVLLSGEGPRVIDFGIARAPGMSLTRTGAVMGTFGYMAPEVLSGSRATQAADVFAWGALIIFAASGVEPFRGANIGEVAHRTAFVEPDLSLLPSRVRPLVAAAVAKDPRLRPSSMELLTGLVGDMPGSADPRRMLMETGARRAEPVTKTPTVVEPPLGERAEAAFAALSGVGRSAAEELMLRLVVPGDAVDGSLDSVRVARPEECTADVEALVRAIDAFTSAGILLRSEEMALRPVSAAVLPAWPRLRQWVGTHRGALAVRLGVAEAAQVWDRHGRRPEDLLQGTALKAALAWQDTASATIRPNPLERLFLQEAEQRAARSARRRRILLSVVASLSVIALLVGLVAWRQYADAERQRDESAARNVAENAEALRSTAPGTAQLLSVAAWRIAPVAEARAALLTAATRWEMPAVDARVPAGGIRFLQPDGRRVLTMNEHALRLWEFASDRSGLVRKPRIAIDDDGGDWRSTGYPTASDNGAFVLLSYQDGSYEVRAADGAVTGKRFRGADGFTAEEVTDTGDVVFRSGDLEVRRLVSASGTTKATWPHSLDRPTYLSPDGNHLITCTDRQKLRFLTLGSGRVGNTSPDEYNGDEEWDPERKCEDVHDVTFGPDGSSALVNVGGIIELWNIRTGERLWWVPADVKWTRFSSDGRHVVGIADHGVDVWAVEHPTESMVTVPVQGTVDGAVLDGSSRTLRVLLKDSDQVRQFDLRNVIDNPGDNGGGPLADEFARTASLAPDGSMLGVSMPRKNSVQLVDMATGRKTGAPFPQSRDILGVAGSFPSSALSNKGALLALSEVAEDGRTSIVLWDTGRRKKLHRIHVPGPASTSAMPQVTLSPDGRYVYAWFGEDSLLGPGSGYLWDTKNPAEPLRTFPRADAGKFDSRGTLFTTTGDAFDPRSGKIRKNVFQGADVKEIAFSPDGEKIATLLNSGWVELWDGTARSRLARMSSSLTEGGSSQGQKFSHFAFSGDGTLLATVVGGGTDDRDPESGGTRVQLWDTTSRLPLGEPLVLTGRGIDLIDFDGSTLRTVSAFDTYSLDLSPGRLTGTVCSRVGRDITREEWETYVPGLPYRKVCSETHR
ncbi:protein kinase domain-containing protein [Streptomyces sp. NPDC054847]